MIKPAGLKTCLGGALCQVVSLQNWVAKHRHMVQWYLAGHCELLPAHQYAPKVSLLKWEVA